MDLSDNEEFSCPYCGETNLLPIDITGGRSQRLIVDCEVCCAPIVITLKISGNEILSMDVKKENE